VSVTVAVHDGLCRSGDHPRLIGSRCASCGGHHFPRHQTCPYCASDDVAETDLADQGTLWAWTAVTAAPPGYLGDVPFGFGVVELTDNSLRVITRLTEADPSRLSLGQPMRLVEVPLHVDDEGNTVTTYAFEPA
jgi:uncharacterized OB-fold protein